MKINCAAVLALLLLSASASAQVAQPTPKPGTYVHDFADVITDDKEAEVQAKAARLKERFKTEIAVVTVETTGGVPAFDYSMRMARSWGIGAKDEESRGLLILVAVKDRTTSFRTSRHVEGELPDGVTGEISRGKMNPLFKKEDFGGGLSAGMDAVLARLEKVYEPPRPPRPASSGVSAWWLLVPFGLVGLVVVIAVVVIIRLRRKGSDGDAFAGWSDVPGARGERDGGVRTTFGASPARRVSYSPRPYERHTETPKAAPPRRAPRPSPKPSSSSRRRSSDDDATPSAPAWTPSPAPDPTPTVQDSSPSYGGSSDFGGGGSDTNW